MDDVSYIFIGLFVGFLAGAWFRGQFDLIKVREGSVFSRKLEPNLTEEESGKKQVLPVHKDRFTNLINKKK